MKASVLLKALEAYGDLDVCVIKKTGPMAYNDTDHHKAVDANVFAIMDNKIIIAEKECPLRIFSQQTGRRYKDED